MDAIFRPLRWTGPSTPWNKRRSRYTFKAGWNNTLMALDAELRHLKAQRLVIEADFREQDIRQDGMPRSNARSPQHPGVRVAFESVHGPLIYQTDTCEFWQHNVRSIALGLTALRAVDRYGVSGRGEQYTGWKALSAGAATAQFGTAEDALRWLQSEDCLGYNGGPGLTVKALLRFAAQTCHPDKGHPPEKWARYDEARRMVEEAGMVT